MEHQFSKPLTLEKPIERNGQTITEVRLRKPASGELRGTNLVALMQMDVSALEVVVPRISQPTITKPEVAQMDPADLTQLAMEVCNFLLPKSAREDFQPA